MTATADTPSPSPAPAHAAPTPLRTFLVLALASTGVVYGDIGTSPLSAFKESPTCATPPGWRRSGT